MRPKKVLIVPDVHAPFHDTKAWALMMKVARYLKPHTIVCLGDLADMFTVSSHSKDPRRSLQLDEELVKVRELRAELDSLKPKRKLFLEGNHEDRLRRYLQDKAPELFSLIDTDKLLGLSENGWEFVGYRDSAKVGKVSFTHDTNQGGKYSTMRALETFQSSVVIGHHHTQQFFVEGDATGKYRVGAQFGWLGDVDKVDYMHRVTSLRKWSLGFGVGYLDSNGVLFLQPVPLVGYRCCVEGRVFDAR